jgi:hypothetical protein
MRRDAINTTRGLVKGRGTRLPKCSTENFSKKVEGALPAEVSELLLPLVRLVETLSSCIRAHDERIEKFDNVKHLAIVPWSPLTPDAYTLGRSRTRTQSATTGGIGDCHVPEASGVTSEIGMSRPVRGSKKNPRQGPGSNDLTCGGFQSVGMKITRTSLGTPPAKGIQ